MGRDDSATATAYRDTGESESYKTSTDEDPVLAAIRRAPFVDLTDEERALLAVVKDPVKWIPHEQFALMLRQRSNRP